jgi:hypothetical protein
VNVMLLEGSGFAAASASPLGAFTLLRVTISADKTIVTANECGRIRLIAIYALGES